MYTVMSVKACIDQKSASSNPAPGSHMDLALRKKSSALSGFASSSFLIQAASGVPGTGAANRRPRARTRYKWQRLGLVAERGSR